MLVQPPANVDLHGVTDPQGGRTCGLGGCSVFDQGFPCPIEQKHLTALPKLAAAPINVKSLAILTP
jgi:hypothetical protein